MYDTIVFVRNLMTEIANIFQLDFASAFRLKCRKKLLGLYQSIFLMYCMTHLVCGHMIAFKNMHQLSTLPAGLLGGLRQILHYYLL